MSRQPDSTPTDTHDGELASRGGRHLPHPSREEIRLEAVLHALSDPTRLHIAQTLARIGEAACSVIEFEVSRSTTTHHYRVLREAGVIRQVYKGTSKLNALRREDLDARFPGLLDSVLNAAASDSPPAVR